MGVDEIAWGEYSGNRGRKGSIMGQSQRHTHTASWGRGRGGLEKLVEEGPETEEENHGG